MHNTRCHCRCPCYTVVNSLHCLPAIAAALQIIQRIGHWLLDSFGTAYIVPGFTPEALLALAFWPGAAQKDFTGYWAERFHVSVPSVLVHLLMPGLDRLEEQAAELAEQARQSRHRQDKELSAKAKRMVQVLNMGAVVVVQDALELAEQYPANPLHRTLLQQPAFRWVCRAVEWQPCAFEGQMLDEPGSCITWTPLCLLAVQNTSTMRDICSWLQYNSWKYSYP